MSDLWTDLVAAVTRATVHYLALELAAKVILELMKIQRCLCPIIILVIDYKKHKEEGKWM